MSDQSPLRGIIAWFASNPVAANLLMLLIIAAGISTMGSLRKEAFPATEPNKITVSVEYKSGSASQSEEGIAIKIEDALEDVIGIKTITSSATTSGATVTIEKQSDYDLDTLLTDVKNKVDSISNFPALAENPIVEKAVREAHAITIQLYGEADRSLLQQVAENLRDDLLISPNINSVSYSGWLDPMMAIEIDEARLQAYDLTLSDVEAAINNNSSNTNTAVLRNENLYLQLKASEQAYFKYEFAEIPLLTTATGSVIRLGSVATIRDTFDDTTSSLSRFNGVNSLGLEVIATGADDITDTVTATNELVQQWRSEGRLPEGLELETWYDSSQSIEERLSLLVRNAGTGILLVFILLALFLNLSVAFWVAAGLPFICFGTLYFMGDNFAGLTLNEFTTFGFIMALGIVVDDAVVIGESIYSTRSRFGDTVENTIKGTMRVAVPTLFGVFTTVVAFMALSEVSGMLGKLYAQFAAVVTICLLLSIVESKLILPSHLSHLRTHRNGKKTNPVARLWQAMQNGADFGLNRFNDRLYRPAIMLFVRYRYAVVVLALTLFVLVMSMPFNGTVRMSFFPDIVGETVRAEVTMLNDASYGQTHSALLDLEQSALQADQMLRTDKGESASDMAIAHLQVLSEADQSGGVVVELADDAPYNINEFTRRWKQLAGQPEGVLTLNILNARRQVDALRIELRANSDEVLESAGADFRDLLKTTPGVSGISSNLDPGQPRIQLTLNPLGRSLGLNTDELAAQIYQAFSGEVVQRYQRNSDEIEVKVRYPERDRQSINSVLSSRVRTPDGEVVPLATVANIAYGYTRDSITRIDNKRAVYVSADVDKTLISATELVNVLKAGIAERLERQYPTLDIHFAGEAEEQAETASSMSHMFLMAMMIIYLLLAVPLKSYIQPLLIMTAIPFGVVGAILGHWLNDLSLGILSLNGIIALSGVVVNDSLLLVSSYNELEEEGQGSRMESIVEACTGRLRAVLLTSVTTFAGLVPLLGETSMQAQFLIPAAVSLGYGILFATLITLIFIPALVMIQEDAKDVIKSLSARIVGKELTS
ncbi:efflux RND transporter permease subunit [Ketobacter sp. MCCC 1A13808]|uniref:efflux RND transporter permease subunit n=1 Tax=Ketobacter sp. MCCC 1A13808 TaxID=2602738 RepID=UPI0012EB701E|nr:efflux RND transporter permease subunit [Ketobacter sp. MCCC 1A13808]MVF12237.1 efflux RND transporter permease subunit [Ketobacter sp. MCCC 1A13808]